MEFDKSSIHFKAQSLLNERNVIYPGVAISSYCNAPCLPKIIINTYNFGGFYSSSD